MDEFEKLMVLNVLPLPDSSQTGVSGQDMGESTPSSAGRLWGRWGRLLGDLLRRRG